MVQVVGVKLKDTGRVYYFNANKINLKLDDMVIVEDEKSILIGKIALEPHNISYGLDLSKLKNIIRKATNKDLEKFKQIKEKEKRAIKICGEKAKKYNLDMKLIDVDYAFDGSKMVFYFSSEERVDFRELVKDLASVFKTRIELRQIGVRDEAKMLGGLGPCGRTFCCSTFLKSFQPVSIKMAKEQNMSLNPVKISGTCGRLMCCLKYEHENYSELLKKTPKCGSCVKTKMGIGTVKDINVLARKIFVQMNDNKDAPPVWMNVSDVKVLEG